VPDNAPEGCRWVWNGLSWTKASESCPAGAVCLRPEEDGAFIGQESLTPCVASQGRPGPRAGPDPGGTVGRPD
jgi:hypothetical protein